MCCGILFKFYIYRKIILVFSCLIALIICICYLTISGNESFVLSTEGCGEICSYRIIESIPARHYPLIRKYIDCESTFIRYKIIEIGKYWPPPKFPPLHIMADLTQNGLMPIKDIKYYPLDFSFKIIRNKPLILDESLFNNLIMQSRKPFINGEIENEDLLRQALNGYRSHLKGKRGLIMGSRNPWVEALILSKSAEQLTISDYQLPTHKIIVQHPQLDVKNPKEISEQYLNKKEPLFDFGIGYLSIGQLGLGRFGEILNQFGDFEAMAQAWCMIKSHGIFILGIYYDSIPYIVWNVYRVYNKERLQFLTANWEVIDIYKGEFLANNIADSTKTMILILRKF